MNPCTNVLHHFLLQGSTFNSSMYDLIIIGAGPAGTSAAVYAARKQLKTLMIAESFGGQSVVSPDIQNWIGTPHISGNDLAASFKKHVEEYKGEHLELKEGVLAQSIRKNDDATFTVVAHNNEEFTSKALLIATGSKRRQLPVPGADEFEHKGLTYCASCDGPVFAGQDVVVVGGGNAGFEAASQLLAYTKSVTLLHRNPEFKADPVTVEKVLEHENMTAIPNAEPTEVFGEGFVKGIKYKEKTTGEEKTLDVTGVFVEIGAIPATDFVKDLVDMTEYGQIKIDPWTQKTSVESIWAAGDCTNVLYHQNNIASGQAVTALEDIYVHLKAK